MVKNTPGSITPEYSVYFGLLGRFAKHNNLPWYGDNFIPARFTDPNYVAPNSGKGVFTTNIVLAAIAFVFVAARFYARAFIAGGLGADDVAIGFSTLLLIGSASLYCYAVRDAGFGLHAYDLDLQHVKALLVIVYAMPIIYNVEVFSIKLSILLFYRRLFGSNRALQRIVNALTLFQVLYTVGCCMGLALICQPVRAWWSLPLRIDHCPNLKTTMVIYVCFRSVSVFTDVLVLCLPLGTFWGLKIPVRQKAWLVVIFGLGVLTCIASVVRLAYLPRLLLNLDVSWNVVPVAVLDELEQSLGIVTSSLPALTAIIAKFRGSIGVNKSEYLSTSSFELSRPKNLEANCQGSIRQPDPGLDFLRLAYDPDNIAVFARAWSTAPPPKKRERFGRVIDRAKKPSSPKPSNEHLVEGISKTTTVEVIIAKRI